MRRNQTMRAATAAWVLFALGAVAPGCNSQEIAPSDSGADRVVVADTGGNNDGGGGGDASADTALDAATDGAVEAGFDATVFDASADAVADASDEAADATADADTTADAADAGNATDAADAVDAPNCTGDGGCFACAPGTLHEFLNQCTASACAPFDNHARLPLLNADGTLPPLP